MKALNIASRFDPHTGAPYYWFVQETNKHQKKATRSTRKKKQKLNK